MQIAYLIPEFPGQTHVMFWRERVALQNIGITTYLVSTRRPPKRIRSHDWASEAERQTFYLTDIGLFDILQIARQLIGLGSTAWLRAVKAAFSGDSLRDSLLNLALLPVAVRLIIFMRANKLAHVHSHSCANAALVAMLANRLGNISYSLTLHGDLRDYGCQQRLKWRHAAFAITITERLRRQIHQELGEDVVARVGLAPMGVNPEVFKRTEPYTPWTGTCPLRLFSCGRLNPSKGHQDLISAVRLLKKSGVDVYLEIAGEDEAGGTGFHRELGNLIVDHQLTENVVLLGAVNEQRVLEGLKAAHLFVLASLSEPLGVAIMEAMSCGTPVIATNSGGVPELIEHEVDGFLTPSGDPNTLAEAIRHLAGNASMTEHFSASGRSKIVQSFNSNLSAVTLGQLLEEMKPAVQRKQSPDASGRS
jgi:glycosyltransferase involved in cell wall biosynthesis